MKSNNSLISMGLVFLMMFCMAFVCNSGDESGGATDGEATSQTAGTTPPSGNNSTAGLPAGKYTCFTTVPIYAGQGAGGYPIYNFSRQTRGAIDVKSNGVYLYPDGARCRYSFDSKTNKIDWLDCTFKEASSSQLNFDDAGKPTIQIKFNGDKDVWDCTK